VDPTLIHLIIRIIMQGLNPHQFYPGKTSDRSLAQRIKESYGDVEKRKRGYKCNVPGHQSTCGAMLPHKKFSYLYIYIYITCILNLINIFNQTIQSKHMITANIHHQGH
jgi:hypothetical protein